MLMCSSFGSSKSFEGDLMDSFKKYDPLGEGMISLSDLRRMIKEMVGSAMSDDEVDETVNVAHERGDGFVEYMKWEALWDACRGMNT
jgi:Ca2+-binding EF-hand superfamily protein